jgi:hypothetical protein
MYKDNKLWSRMLRAWDYYASSEWLFLLTMPVIIGLAVALLVHIGDARWDNSIKNKYNEEYVIEVAFDLDIPVEEVTQKQFNARYK